MRILTVVTIKAPFIRTALPGEEAAIHKAHMRSINEICVKDHGEDEIRGWGNRPLSNHWDEAVNSGGTYVVDLDNEIVGLGHMRLIERPTQRHAYLHALYLTPEVTGLGLAREMMERFFVDARIWQVDSIRLHSSITAYSFYKKFGFVDSGAKQLEDIGGYPVTSYPMVFQLLNKASK